MASAKLQTYFVSLMMATWLLACGGDSKQPVDSDDDEATTDDDSSADDDTDDDSVTDDDTGKEDPPPKKDAASDTPKKDAASDTPKKDAGSDAGAPPSKADASTPNNDQPAGPEDGDPSKPVVAIDGVKCRDPNARSFGIGMPNFMYDGRDMIVDYPCEKHEGAPVTFILNLHGTTPVAQHFYQWGYFAAYKHVASHNLVIVTPSSVVTQWGNGDGGVDEPHLMKIIDWVYTTFGAKFDIRAMWVGGHSWGSFYTAQFGCKEELKDKVKGLILMSGARPPACASRISILNTAANLGPDGAVKPEGLLNQTANATAHGCDASMMRAVDANNDETYWPNCDPGWVHANYLMKTKQHATFMDPSVVKSLVDYIKQSRQ